MDLNFNATYVHLQYSIPLRLSAHTMCCSPYYSEKKKNSYGLVSVMLIDNV